MKNEMNDRVVAALRSYMEERGVSQADVARHLGRSESYVSGRMSGRLDLSLDIMASVAGLTSLSPHALMAELTSRMGLGA